jgi:hypothetical protein
LAFLEFTMSTDPSPEKPARPPIPAWAWIFAVACGIIPVLTLGGAIPGAIGFGGAGGCISVARNTSMSVESRVAGCIAITVSCWALVIVIVGGLAVFTHR